MAEAQAPNITYRGNCHCGAFVFEIGIPEIKSVMACNCSICTKKGYLLLFPGGLDDLKIVKGSIEDLTNYTFSKGKLHHKFCPQCGTAIMVTMPNGLPNLNFGLNARSIQGLDTWSLARQPIDGASLGDKYEAPSYSGAQPPEQIDGGNNTLVPIAEVGSLKAPRGSGPRHGFFRVMANGEDFFTFNGELDQKVYSYKIKYYRTGLSFTKVFEIPSLDANFPPNTAPISEIAMSRFLIITNREKSLANSPQLGSGPSDTLTTFQINEDGTLKPIQAAPSGGWLPR
ncbi:hypothetical protein IL306_007433 [Fusarium sp. DS 682]|nr:hypothetical protein IL306_007433 [Fusarium sp. DS 682]